LSLTVPEISDVTLVVYDLLGREIITLVNEQMNAGLHNLIWNGRDHFGILVSTGIYIYRITAISRESENASNEIGYSPVARR